VDALSRFRMALVGALALVPGILFSQAGPKAAVGNPELLVSMDQLAGLAQSDPALRIVDFGRSRHEYEAGHIPGSVYLDRRDVLSMRGGVSNMLAPVEELVKALEQAGIGNKSRVVIYDDSGDLWASRLFWTLEYLGHDRAALLDGGIARWQAEGRRLQRGAEAAAPARFTPDVQENRLASAEWIRERLGAPGLDLVDARGQEEYSGRDARAARGGHIPGAIHLDWNANLAKDGSFLPLEELRARFEGAGVGTEDTAVTYCQSGIRAAHDYFVLRLLGYADVRLYDGSWEEWGNDARNPVDQDSSTR
jgi:thiosulfate/3-mercaptopyruvate sulfurtransferase